MITYISQTVIAKQFAIVHRDVDACMLLSSYHANVMCIRTRAREVCHMSHLPERKSVKYSLRTDHASVHCPL